MLALLLTQMLRSEDPGVHYEAVGVLGNLVHSSQDIKQQVLQVRHAGLLALQETCWATLFTASQHHRSLGPAQAALGWPDLGDSLQHPQLFKKRLGMCLSIGIRQAFADGLHGLCCVFMSFPAGGCTAASDQPPQQYMPRESAGGSPVAGPVCHTDAQ